MSQADRMFRHIEAAGMRQLEVLYFTALLKQVKGEDANDEWDAFARTLTRVMVLCNLAGRLGVVLKIGKPKLDEQPFAPKELANYDEQDGILTGPFEQAINWFLNKVPTLRRVVDRLLPAARARAFWVTGIETTEGLARIQAKLAKPLAAETDGGMSEFIHSEEEISGLAQARLETVYRTNTMSALAAGATEQIHDPVMKPAVALIQLNEIHDRRTRGNPNGLYPHQGKHWQMDGFVESPDNQVWKLITPPAGFFCRGTVGPIGWLTAEKMGLAREGKLIQSALDKYNGGRWELIRSGKYPDPGFKK